MFSQNTVLGAPTSVVKLNGTGGRLNPSEIADEFRDNPSLPFFCGFSGVVRLSLADGKTRDPEEAESVFMRVLFWFLFLSVCLSIYECQCVCVCVCVCLRACVRARACVFVYVCVCDLFVFDGFSCY